jgi:hypothetical protein
MVKEKRQKHYFIGGICQFCFEVIGNKTCKDCKDYGCTGGYCNYMEFFNDGTACLSNKKSVCNFPECEKNNYDCGWDKGVEECPIYKLHKNYIKVITLCGSTRFKRDFRRIEQELNFKGNLVISLNNFTHIEDKDPRKEMLNNIHFKRIDLSDSIFVINKDNYIGNSTKREIEYAKEKGKEIIYMEG